MTWKFVRQARLRASSTHYGVAVSKDGSESLPCIHPSRRTTSRLEPTGRAPQDEIRKVHSLSADSDWAHSWLPLVSRQLRSLARSAAAIVSLLMPAAPADTVSFLSSNSNADCSAPSTL